MTPLLYRGIIHLGLSRSCISRSLHGLGNTGWDVSLGKRRRADRTGGLSLCKSYAGRELTRLRAAMHIDAFQSCQFQAKLWCSLVLLHKFILREDARALGQFLQCKALRKLLDVAHLILCQIEDSG